MIDVYSGSCIKDDLTIMLNIMLLFLFSFSKKKCRNLVNCNMSFVLYMYLLNVNYEKMINF